MLQTYNTYSLEQEEFQPLQAGQIKMYVCGPTVYNYIHLGNARSAIAFDTIRRYFEYVGYKVNYVSNFTDLGDKILAQAEKEGLTEEQVAQKYEAAFDEDTAQLTIKPATVRSKATEVMPEIVDYIENLVDQGLAYESEGDVYFSAKKSPNYGHLSHQNFDELEENAAGRLDPVEAKRKKDPIDFALWKGEHREGVKAWPSPWGPGRPGWHIECSVMIQKYLGSEIDIHGGGIDLAFPHHTNEIAQSEGHNHEQFVRYWMHNGFVNVNDEKMSKSLGNFTTVHDLLANGVDPQALRYLLGKTHYRRPINYSMDTLNQAQIELDRIRRAYQALTEVQASETGEDLTIIGRLDEMETRFREAMDDDFNTENALTVVFELVNLVNQYSKEDKQQETVITALQKKMTDWLAIFGIVDLLGEDQLNETEQALFDQRAEARAAKDFVKSDQLRDQLANLGITVRDTSQGQKWERKQAY